jgi:hypothetical protein
MIQPQGVQTREHLLREHVVVFAVANSAPETLLLETVSGAFMRLDRGVLGRR